MSEYSQEARDRAEARFVTALNNRRELTDHDRGTLVKIESLVLELATSIEQHVPDGRHKSLALTHLEDVLTRANKGIYIEGSLSGPSIDVAYVGGRGNIVYFVAFDHPNNNNVLLRTSTPVPETFVVSRGEFETHYDRAPEFDS